LRAARLKTELYAIYLAYQDPRVPRRARWFAALVVGYAFSPIDLIPDPIPVLGYLDDLLLVPLGIALALKMIPAEVMEECRQKAQETAAQGKPVSGGKEHRWMAAVVIILIWIVLAVLVMLWIARILGMGLSLPNLI
jgi:uncharacterized membrane protein YkvA (DUF1232 family)